MEVTDGSVYRATGGTCTGHKDKTKLSHKMLLPPGHFGYTIMIFGGHSAANALTPVGFELPSLELPCPHSRLRQQGSQENTQGCHKSENIQFLCPLAPGYVVESQGTNELLILHLVPGPHHIPQGGDIDPPQLNCNAQSSSCGGESPGGA